MPVRNVYSKLVELSNSGYEIVSDEPDIRKWKVVNGQGRTLGVVDELLLDKQLNKIRYIVLSLDGKPFRLLSRKILIPIGIADLDEVQDIVILPNISFDQIVNLPDYRRGKLTLDTERKIRYAFMPANTPADCDDTVADDTFYTHEHFNDTNLLKRKKKPESQSGVSDEGGVIDRTHESDSNLSSPFKESVIEITENAEVPVVSKEVRVVEEVDVNKQVEEEDEKIKDSVRRTEVKVENLNRSDDQL